MPTQGTTLGTAYGLTAVLTTNATLIGNIMSVGTAPEMSRKSIKTTHSSSTGGWETFIGGDIKDGGMLEVTCQYNTQLDYGALFIAAICDTITVTFPKRATTCGGTVAATGATWSASVVCEKVSPKWDFEDLMLVTLTFKISGAPTYVPAAT